MRHGKGTYWLCIGKNKYRKFYTGDWFENKKEGKGIFFYKDGGCYDGNWKNSKRHGKGLMIYSNGDIYEGNWLNDLRHGYGIMEYAFPEDKKGHKYYGYWSNGLKEGQGYYYYSNTGKIYLGEWHEDYPRTGIFTDVQDEKAMKVIEESFKSEDKAPEIRILRLQNPDKILEESITNVHFVRQIKLTKNKNFSELFAIDYQQELISLFKSKQGGFIKDENNENSGKEKIKIPDTNITIIDFISIFKTKYNVEIDEEILELVLKLFLIVSDDKKFSLQLSIDFLLFSRLFYLMYIKYVDSPPEIDFSVHSKDNNKETDDIKNDYNNVISEEEIIKESEENINTIGNNFNMYEKSNSRYDNFMNEENENEEYDEELGNSEFQDLEERDRTSLEDEDSL